jgi:hypothetical protein
VITGVDVVVLIKWFSVVQLLGKSRMTDSHTCYASLALLLGAVVATSVWLIQDPVATSEVQRIVYSDACSPSSSESLLSTVLSVGVKLFPSVGRFSEKLYAPTATRNNHLCSEIVGLDRSVEMHTLTFSLPEGIIMYEEKFLQCQLGGGDHRYRHQNGLHLGPDGSINFHS